GQEYLPPAVFPSISSLRDGFAQQTLNTGAQALFNGDPPEQYQEIGALHGMAGIGSADLNAYQWTDMYQHATAAMGNPTAANSGAIGGFGTDTDGLAMGMPPRPGSRVQYSKSFPISSSGTK